MPGDPQQAKGSPVPLLTAWHCLINRLPEKGHLTPDVDDRLDAWRQGVAKVFAKISDIDVIMPLSNDVVDSQINPSKYQEYHKAIRKIANDFSYVCDLWNSVVTTIANRDDIADSEESDLRRLHKTAETLFQAIMFALRNRAAREHLDDAHAHLEISANEFRLSNQKRILELLDTQSADMPHGERAEELFTVCLPWVHRTSDIQIDLYHRGRQRNCVLLFSNKSDADTAFLNIRIGINDRRLNRRLHLFSKKVVKEFLKKCLEGIRPTMVRCRRLT